MNAFFGLILVVLSTTGEAATFAVDPGKSHITVSADATGGGFKGYLRKYEASIIGDAATLKPSSAKVTWNFADLDTKKEGRNKKMLKWLEVGSYPSGSFVLKRIFDKKTAGVNQTYAYGTITIHGVSKKLVFPISTAKKGDFLTISGRASLDTETDFKLPIIRMALIAKVSPKLTVDFSLTGTIK